MSPFSHAQRVLQGSFSTLVSQQKVSRSFLNTPVSWLLVASFIPLNQWLPAKFYLHLERMRGKTTFLQQNFSFTHGFRDQGPAASVSIPEGS